MLRTDGRWQKASTSARGRDCVQVRVDSRGVGIEVGDTKMSQALPFSFTHDEWRAFLDAVKAGEFDLAPSGCRPGH
ncbi:DUF397 domain-containing protein [Kineosporia sp. NBRC 101731]|uniref:DUF397 domain-containing protein n=1 Tax=Kineosporia sp. NBRC 101731 TaxID=3032199 RepID=UPI0024A33B6A|nr:DUF397 domain-containing protein [Kineosporia sp. NBRC 101731]GLY29082.1 hypothetical protein Kisp02_24470 [Kineosporia sp. NBRC 101731]